MINLSLETQQLFQSEDKKNIQQLTQFKNNNNDFFYLFS